MRSSSSLSTSSGRKARSQTTSGVRVEHLVDALEAEVRHPDVVEVRVAERDAEGPLARDGRERGPRPRRYCRCRSLERACHVGPARGARVDQYTAETPGKPGLCPGRGYDGPWSSATAARPTGRPRSAARPLRLEPAKEARRVPAGAVTGLFVLACLYTLRAAQDFLMPLVIGVMLYFLLVPVVRGAPARGACPTRAGRAVVVLGLIVVVGLGAYALSWPATAWMARAPDGLRPGGVEAEAGLPRRREALADRPAGRGDHGGPRPRAPPPRSRSRSRASAPPSSAGCSRFLGGAAIILTLVYFLLASGDNVIRKIVQSFPRLADRQRAESIAREMEEQISAYLLLTTMINAVFGVVVAARPLAAGDAEPDVVGRGGRGHELHPLPGRACSARVVIGLAALLAFEDVVVGAARAGGLPRAQHPRGLRGRPR